MTVALALLVLRAGCGQAARRACRSPCRANGLGAPVGSLLEACPVAVEVVAGPPEAGRLGFLVVGVVRPLAKLTAFAAPFELLGLRGAPSGLT